MLYLGWIVAAFLSGCIVTALFMSKRRTLRERVLSICPLVDRDYSQSREHLKTEPQSTITQPNGQKLRAWEDGRYFISMLFDQNERCLGVMDERG